jgi:general secretion pathway protein G
VSQWAVLSDRATANNRVRRDGRGASDPPIPRSSILRFFRSSIRRSPDRQVPASSSGFTMIELLIVMTLMVILATMGMTQYRTSVVHAREATLKEDLFRMRDAIDQYYADKGQYPATLDALVSDGYMRKVPIDPFTRNASSWQTVPAEPDTSNPTAEPGVFDVKSGSDQTAIDGSKYSDW